MILHDTEHRLKADSCSMTAPLRDGLLDSSGRPSSLQAELSSTPGCSPCLEGQTTRLEITHDSRAEASGFPGWSVIRKNMTGKLRTRKSEEESHTQAKKNPKVQIFVSPVNVHQRVISEKFNNQVDRMTWPMDTDQPLSPATHHCSTGS